MEATARTRPRSKPTTARKQRSPPPRPRPTTETTTPTLSPKRVAEREALAACPRSVLSNKYTYIMIVSENDMIPFAFYRHAYSGPSCPVKRFMSPVCLIQSAHHGIVNSLTPLGRLRPSWWGLLHTWGMSVGSREASRCAQTYRSGKPGCRGRALRLKKQVVQNVVLPTSSSST